MYLKWDQYYNIVINDAINEYIYVILLNISDLLAGFLVLYIKFSLKKKNIIQNTENSDNNQRNSKIEIIEGKGKVVPKSRSFIYKIIFICALDYLNRLAFFNFIKQIQKQIMIIFLIKHSKI